MRIENSSNVGPQKISNRIVKFIIVDYKTRLRVCVAVIGSIVWPRYQIETKAIDTSTNIYGNWDLF